MPLPEALWGQKKGITVGAAGGRRDVELTEELPAVCEGRWRGEGRWGSLSWEVMAGVRVMRFEAWGSGFGDFRGLMGGGYQSAEAKRGSRAACPSMDASSE